MPPSADTRRVDPSTAADPPAFERSGPDPRRLIPRTDTLLASAEFAEATRRLGEPAVKTAIRAAQDAARNAAIPPTAVAQVALLDLSNRRSTTLRPVMNATGVILHTNLGRARLSSAAQEALSTAAGYCDVEFDLADGRRARRGRGTLAALQQRLPEGTGCLVVNNGAAALALTVAALAVATGRPEVVVSRGEFVEIGDGFRIPELLDSVGARLREVGTTNRTHLPDYRDALGSQTGAVLKVHPSNFRISGFTSGVDVASLSRACRERELPLVVDIGGGLLTPDPLLPDEPDATSMLRAGAHLVTASCDKLLGGPQGGLVLGDPELVERVRRHPLARAMRVDKTTLAALEATLRDPRTPTVTALHVQESELRDRADRLAALIGGHAAHTATDQASNAGGDGGSPPGPTRPIVRVVPSRGAVGGGCAPGVELSGWAVAVPEQLAAPLRAGSTDRHTPAVVGRLESGHLLLDVRCLPEDELPLVAAAVLAAAATSNLGAERASPSDGAPDARTPSPHEAG